MSRVRSTTRAVTLSKTSFDAPGRSSPAAKSFYLLGFEGPPPAVTTALMWGFASPFIALWCPITCTQWAQLDLSCQLDFCPIRLSWECSASWDEYLIEFSPVPVDPFIMPHLDSGSDDCAGKPGSDPSPSDIFDKASTMFLLQMLFA